MKITSTYSDHAILVEESTLGGATPAFVGVEESPGKRFGVHLTGEQVRDLIEALKPHAAEEPLAEWERELLGLDTPEPIQEVDGFHLGDEVEGYTDGRGVIVGFEDEAMKRGASGDVVVEWSEGFAIAGRTLGASLSELTKVEPKPVQEIPTGATVKVLDSGDGPGQVLHFGEVGAFAKVIGWTDTSAEPWGYDETYEIEFEGPGEPLVQSVAPSSIRTLTLAESLDRAAKAIAAMFPARYVTGVDSTDPAVRIWSEAITDRPFVSYGFEEEDDDVEPEPRFSVGDRVKVVDDQGDESAEVGMIGTVKSVGSAPDFLTLVEVEERDRPIGMFETRFEPAPEPKVEVEIHDRVRIVGGPFIGAASAPGGTGRVVKVLEDDSARPFLVETDDRDGFPGQRLHYAADEIEHVAGFFSPVSCPDCHDGPCEYPSIKRR